METRDYSKFKILPANRDITEKNVEKIVNSVKEWGIIPGRPILIDGMGFIIDGQHRFYAYKKLGLPIPYEVINGDVISKTMALNSSQKQWGIDDYVKSYSEQGIDCFRKTIKYDEKYKLGMNKTLAIIAPHIKTPTIKHGKTFEISDDVESIFEYHYSLPNVSFKNNLSLIRSIVVLHKKANQSQLKTINSNFLRIKKSALVEDYLNQFENIINYKKRGKNIIKL